MHYGFAMPILSLPFALIVALLVPNTIGDAIIVSCAGGFVLGGAVAEWRAARRIRRWAMRNGISNVVKLPRGGFVSWGFTFWTFAEMNWYRGTDSRGRMREFVASYAGYGYGLIVAVYCEAEPATEPNEQPR